jgi:putative SOS response-associated peptidase YedK
MIKQRQSGPFTFAAEYRTDIQEFYDQLIVPYHPAPVLVRDKDTAWLTPMKFSMVPAWSKEPKVKFATHNARLESIEEKPTWKHVFVKRHCLVPLTDFIEPIYEGEHAGYMVAFARKDGGMFYAAGVWDEWVNRQTGEVIQSFAIITSDPPDFIARTGHDRCPVFLNEQYGREWLANAGAPAPELKQFLLAGKSEHDFEVSRHRPMRPGWEKRK